MSETDAATIRDLTRALEDEVRTREDGLEPMIKRLKEELAETKQAARDLLSDKEEWRRACGAQVERANAAEAENASLREALGDAISFLVAVADEHRKRSELFSAEVVESAIARYRACLAPATTNATTADDARRE